VADRLRDAGHDVVILGLNAFGGTALIRVLASVPEVQAIAFVETPVQTVSARDSSQVVLDNRVLHGNGSSNSCCSLLSTSLSGLGNSQKRAPEIIIC
jgi:hypothetical protein